MSRPPLPFGLRAHDHGRASPEELAARLADCGASFVQLAPAKALAGVQDIRGWDPDAIAACAKAFHHGDIALGILGAYVELGAEGDEAAAEAGERFAASMSAASLIAATIGLSPLVASEAGARGSGSESGTRRRRFLRAFASLAELGARVGVRLALEAARGHLVQTPRELEKTLQALGEPSIAIVLDPVNLILDAGSRDPLRPTRDLLDRLPDRIEALHLKDFVPGPDGPRVVPPGRGVLDFEALFDAMDAVGLRVPCYIEACPPEALPLALTRLRDCGMERAAMAPDALRRGATVVGQASGARLR